MLFIALVFFWTTRASALTPGDEIVFPTERVIEQIASCPPRAEATLLVACLMTLNDLALSASAGAESVAISTAGEVELVRDPAPPVGVAASRQWREERRRQFETFARGSETPIEFNRLTRAILSRSALPRRDVAIETVMRRMREADPYLRLFSPVVHTPARRLTLNLMARADSLVLGSVPPRSNLDHAGLGLGDRVLKVGGEPLSPRNAAQVVGALPPGDTVDIEVETIAGKRVNVTVPRREANDAVASGYVMEVNERRIGVVRLESFGDPRACDQTADVLRHLSDAKVDRLIYDLRGNAGGLVDQARCVLGLHLGRGKKLWTQRLLTNTPTFAQARAAFPRAETLFTNHNRVAPAVPTVVLINHASASAAELFAATLRERGTAWIVGARSFGKGVAQAALPLIPDSNLMVWKTIARAEHRAGFSVQGQGVTPDFVVKSEFGRARDGDDDLRPRFTEAFGPAFAADVRPFRRSDSRSRAYHRARMCVRYTGLRTDSTVARWLRDHQLRGAASVALCAEE